MLVRGSSLERGMSQYLVDQIGDTENIEVRLRSEVVEVHGENQLEAISVINRDTGDCNTYPAGAMFIFIGAEAHTDFLADIVERNNAGFVITGPDLTQNGKRPRRWKLKRDPYLMETSVPGIFAAGDVRHGSTKRVASAVGEGSVCVRFVHQYLKEV
jgi:thioredoxin reductase (NADPH)